MIRSFVPVDSVFELTKPFRTNNTALLDFWAKVRDLEEGIDEVIAQNGYSAVLDQSLFEVQLLAASLFDGVPARIGKAHW